MPEWLVDLFARYGYAVVFFGVLLENAGVPVPGETTLLAGAALAQFGRLSLPWVVVCAARRAVRPIVSLDDTSPVHASSGHRSEP